MTSSVVDSAPAPEAATEVFVDDSGRRHRTLVRAGYAVGAACLLYVALLGVSFAGGPIGPRSLLPVPGLPEKVADGPLGMSHLLGLGTPDGGSSAAPAAVAPTPGVTGTPHPSVSPSARRGTGSESLTTVTPAAHSPVAAGGTAAPTPKADATSPTAEPTPSASGSPTAQPSTESATTDPPTDGTGLNLPVTPDGPA